MSDTRISTWPSWGHQSVSWDWRGVIKYSLHWEDIVLRIASAIDQMKKTICTIKTNKRKQRLSVCVCVCVCKREREIQLYWPPQGRYTGVKQKMNIVSSGSDFSVWQLLASYFKFWFFHKFLSPLCNFPRTVYHPKTLWSGCSNGKDLGDIFQEDNMWFLNKKEGFTQICESPKGQMYGKDSYLPPISVLTAIYFISIKILIVTSAKTNISQVSCQSEFTFRTNSQ